MKYRLFFIPVLLFITSCFTFDDGPFSGTPFNDLASIEGVEASEAVSYKKGKIEVFNRSAQETPLILYRSGDNVVWAVSLETPENTFVEEISGIGVEKGLLKDKLTFTAYWTYGAERGYAYFTARTFKNFYLSW